MDVWSRRFTTSQLDAHQADSSAGRMGIRFTAIGDNWLEASMPLDSRTADASGCIGGGALSILAETVASIAATIAVDSRVRYCLGQSLTVHHVASTSNGPVRARTWKLADGDRSQVWQVEARDANGTLVALAEMTMAVIDGQPRHAPTTPIA